MSIDKVKMPMQALLDASLDMIRLRGDVTNAVVIIFNHRTGEAKLGGLEGGPNEAIRMMEAGVNSLKKAGRGGGRTQSGIIIPQ
jgi:hypothetical protein